MICVYWCFKAIGYKFESDDCNKCYGISVMAFELENIAIFNAKDIQSWLQMYFMEYD